MQKKRKLHYTRATHRDTTMAYEVQRPYRTNPLSKVDGGVTVRVEYVGGGEFDYKDVKNPTSYIAILEIKPNVKRAYVLKP